MGPKSAHDNRFLVTALSISLAGHLCAMLLFRFTFPLLPQPYKPYGVFLGSILRQPNFIVTPPVYPHSTPSQILAASFTKNDRQSQIYRRDHVSTDKPVMNTAVFSTRPQTKKSPNTDAPAVHEQTPSGADIGLDVQIDPYRPLRLNPHDRN